MTGARRWLLARGPYRRSIRRRVLAGGLMALVGCGMIVGAMVGGSVIVRRCSAFDLTVIPVAAPAYQLASSPKGRWRAYHGRGIVVHVPLIFQRHPQVSSVPDALVLTNRRQTLWLSITVQRVPSRWSRWWYRWCLYARRNPVGLMGKSLLVPPMGTRSPQLVEQQLGPWQGYLYCAPRLLVADLLDETHRVRVVVAARRDGLLDVEQVRAILASIRVQGAVV